jgi:hypothetical protein
MSKMTDMVNARIKCRAYKDADNPDGRESLCGEPRQIDEDGREFFEVPGHQREYLQKLLPSYEFSEEYDITDQKADMAPKKSKGGRPPKARLDDE